ncbi:YggT family protein [Sanguibacter antarcticus]|uniref:YggT family protein n=1 Tax=Sanguibacter antarcticus TaxID=372484 RepID=A0A2A9E490_9MICO|nr:YggT family protein [Sanguibacter antarcticus]PFG33456.1 YggT family protein [Sanguibacter antarcticus]
MVWSLLAFLCLLYTIVLIGRVIFDWVQVFSRSWRPQGVLLVVAEVVYSLTDPPVKFLRRKIPPLPIGRVRLDVGFLILFVGVSFLMQVFTVLANQ